MKLDKNKVKEAAQGRGLEILEHVAKIPAEYLDGKHHPCPQCGGTDRFRYDLTKEFVICNQCFNERNGDFIAAVQHFCDIDDFQEALRLIANYLNVQPEEENISPQYTASKKTSSQSGKANGKGKLNFDINKPSATYRYTDENDTLLFEVRRYVGTYSDGTTDKTFLQCRPDPDKPGKRIWKGIDAIRQVPYNLPGILKPTTKTVFVVEGEKDADRLNRLLRQTRNKTAVATTSANGAKNASSLWPGFAKEFKLYEKQIRVIPDNDANGIAFAKSVCMAINLSNTFSKENSKCPDIKIVELPDLPEKGDFSDWIGRLESDGKTLPEIIESLTELCKAAPPIDDDSVRQWDRETVRQAKNEEKKASHRPILIDPSTLERRETSWLWKNKLPSKRLNLLTGLKGQGKTFWTCYLASVITNGWTWAGGEPCGQGSVLFFRGEDIIEEDYIPRLEANGANLSKIRFLDGIEILQGNGDKTERTLTIKDLGDIESAIAETAVQTGVPVRLVVIDPISNYWGGIKENDNGEVRSVLDPLAKLAEKTEAAFLLIQHTGKAIKEHAQQKVLGSTGLTAICRTLWGLYLDKTSMHRFFAPIDTNCCIDPTAVEFIVSKENGGRVEIIDADLDKTGDDLEAEHRKASQGDTDVHANKIEKCKKWLKEFLKDGPQYSQDVFSEAKKKTDDKESFSSRTVERAKTEIGDELGIKIAIKDPITNRWMWSLSGENDIGHKEDRQLFVTEDRQISIHAGGGGLGGLPQEMAKTKTAKRGKTAKEKNDLAVFKDTLENKGNNNNRGYLLCSSSVHSKLAYLL